MYITRRSGEVHINGMFDLTFHATPEPLYMPETDEPSPFVYVTGFHWCAIPSGRWKWVRFLKMARTLWRWLGSIEAVPPDAEVHAEARRAYERGRQYTYEAVKGLVRSKVDGEELSSKWEEHKEWVQEHILDTPRDVPDA